MWLRKTNQGRTTQLQDGNSTLSEDQDQPNGIAHGFSLHPPLPRAPPTSGLAGQVPAAATESVIPLFCLALTKVEPRV